MRTNMRTRLTFAAISLLVIAVAVALGARTSEAEKGASSSACIKCHTDLEKMDSYGAASAGGTAAIAG